MNKITMIRKIVATLFLSTLFITTIYSQWQPMGEGLLPDTQRVASISVLDENVVWGVAYYDRTPAPVPSHIIPSVFRTVDGGEEWEVFPIQEAQGRICQDIFAINDSVAWITTNGLTADSLRGLFKTMDGGKTWEEKLNDPAGGGLIHFFDDTMGIAIHEQFMAYTFDGGENWADNSIGVFPLGTTESIFYTAGNNALATSGDTLWLGTTHGNVLRSLNRGFDWEVLPTPFENNDIIISTAFRNPQEGIIISYAHLDGNAILFADSTKVALTFDGGETWELADTLFDFKVNCVTGVPDSDIQFLGVSNGLSTLTSDTAQTWQHFSFRPYNAVSFFNAELGWVGNSQTSEDHPALIYKWEGVISPTKNIAKRNLDINIFPNPFFQNFYLEMDVLDFEKYQKEELTLDIFDILGKKIMSKKITTPLSPIHFSQKNPTGIYFYFLKTKNEIRSSGRLQMIKS